MLLREYSRSGANGSLTSAGRTQARCHFVCVLFLCQDDDTDEFLAGAATRHDELGRDFMQLQARPRVPPPVVDQFATRGGT